MPNYRRPMMLQMGENFDPTDAQPNAPIGLPATAVPGRVNVRQVTMTPDQMQRQVTDKLRAGTFAQQRANGMDEKAAHRAAYIAANTTGADLAAQDNGYGANYTLNRGFAVDANTRRNAMNASQVGVNNSIAGVNTAEAGQIGAQTKTIDAHREQIMPRIGQQMDADRAGTQANTYGKNLATIRYGLETPFHLAGLGLQNKAAGYQVGAMPAMLAAQQSAAELGNRASEQQIKMMPDQASYAAQKAALDQQMKFLGQVGGLMGRRFMQMEGDDGGDGTQYSDVMNPFSWGRPANPKALMPPQQGQPATVGDISSYPVQRPPQAAPSPVAPAKPDDIPEGQMMSTTGGQIPNKVRRNGQWVDIPHRQPEAAQPLPTAPPPLVATAGPVSRPFPASSPSPAAPPPVRRVSLTEGGESDYEIRDGVAYRIERPSRTIGRGRTRDNGNMTRNAFLRQD